MSSRRLTSSMISGSSRHVVVRRERPGGEPVDGAAGLEELDVGVHHPTVEVDGDPLLLEILDRGLEVVLRVEAVQVRSPQRVVLALDEATGKPVPQPAGAVGGIEVDAAVEVARDLVLQILGLERIGVRRFEGLLDLALDRHVPHHVHQRELELAVLRLVLGEEGEGLTGEVVHDVVDVVVRDAVEVAAQRVGTLGGVLGVLDHRLALRERKEVPRVRRVGHAREDRVVRTDRTAAPELRVFADGLGVLVGQQHVLVLAAGSEQLDRRLAAPCILFGAADAIHVPDELRSDLVREMDVDLDAVCARRVRHRGNCRQRQPTPENPQQFAFAHDVCPCTTIAAQLPTCRHT